MDVNNELSNFVRAELDDGVPFEEFLEGFDLTPEEVFVHLFEAGLIDQDTLEAKLLDFE